MDKETQANDSFDLSFIRDCLREHRDSCTRLIERLSKTGIALETRDKALLRQALLKSLQDRFDELSYSYLVGNKGHCNHSIDRVKTDFFPLL